MNPVDPAQNNVIQCQSDHLKNFMTPERFSRFEKVLISRTRHITLVLEDVFQSHNTSAVLRSCDCFGIQDVHIIENRNKYQVNPDVALGASKWLNIHKYNDSENNTVSCLRKLKEKGYRIVATSPHKEDYTPETLPLDRKIALVFGTELEGLTATALDHADHFVRIPMYGFTESLNISVSAAIIMQALTTRLHNSEFSWQLTKAESDELLVQWMKASIKNADNIIRKNT